MSTQERTRPRPVAASQTATTTIPKGFVACGSCGEPTLPEDLYAAEIGEICHQCNAAEEAADVSSRGARDQAMTLFFSPGYVALAVAILAPLAQFLFASPGLVLAPIPLFSTYFGLRGVYEAAVLPHEHTGDRVRLAVAGVWSVAILLLLASTMAGVLG